jgi:SH3 domain protein
MYYFSIIFTLIIIASNIIVPLAEADTRYVGDELMITLRQGKSTSHKILKNLQTGTPVEVLEEGQAYLKVRTKDGTEGYVLRQYISSKTPKAYRIEELETENTKLLGNQTTNSSLEKQLHEIQGKNDQKFSDLAAKSSDTELNLEKALNNERIATEKFNALVAQSGDIVKIVEERDKLRKENNKLKSGIKALQEKNETIADLRMIKWFLAGAGVLFFGWIIGRISRKKRSRY